ncbi:MAG: hypothetical protein IBX55_19475 [Methyloprofundus sp.]|nr:hypothetical protein [Methyloprofundus sp.]
MEIVIEYESSWRNSFLDGSNNDPLPKDGRKYIASGQALGNSKNYLIREVTQDTVLGLLSRLIGDQRKLYQAKKTDSFFFNEMVSTLSWEDQAESWDELVYLRNMSGSDDQNSFTGSIKLNDPRLTSDYSGLLWGVLALSSDELVDYILNNSEVKAGIELTPFSIIERLEEIQKIKASDPEGKAEEAAKFLDSHFDKSEPLNPKGQIKWIAMYCASLYLQIERLRSQGFNLDSATTNSGSISGVSFNGFTKKDFLAKFTTTGIKKKVWGNPYIMKERIKGEGEKISMLKKARGKLFINLDISREKAIELKNMIENAGVSSFYLGKKGLAYVTSIRT